MSEPQELYLKYRPQKFGELVGQAPAVEALTSLGRAGKIPHVLMLTGPSGCGKTTAGRITARALGCHARDFVELNAANTRGIDTVRSIQGQAGMCPMAGAVRVWIIDEAHQLTADAQDAFLKLLEDTPPHVYFILCTTNPGKVKRTITTRSTVVKFQEVSAPDAKALIERVAAAESITLTPAVAARIVELGGGSPRQLLVLLNQIQALTDETAQLTTLQDPVAERDSIEICRALMGKTTWPKMVEILNAVTADPEDIRRLVLGYATSTLLKSGKELAAVIIEEFKFDWYNCGKAGLVLACFNVIRGGK